MFWRLYPAHEFLFKNRIDAGDRLAAKLQEKLLKKSPNGSWEPRSDLVVLGLPRGGVPVAARISTALSAPLDVIVSKKIGFPGNEEFAIGAVTARGSRVLNNDVINQYGRSFITKHYIEEQTSRLIQICKEKERQFRGGRDSFVAPLRDRVVLLVDDGIATGMTMRAALIDVANQHPRQIFIVAPVLARDTLRDFQQMNEVTDIIYIDAPEDFRAVGRFYEDFSQTEDEECIRLMNQFSHA